MACAAANGGPGSPLSPSLVSGLAVALPAHYPFGFDTLGHLGLIYLDTALFVVGVVLALSPLINPRGQQGPR